MDVSDAEVVGEDEDDVGWGRRGGGVEDEDEDGSEDRDQ